MSNTRISGRLVLALVCAPLLMGGACEKKKPNDTGAISAMDRAGQAAEPSGPVDTTPLPGIDVSKLGEDRQQLFYKLIGSFKSPCGKTHSLRTSFTQDTSCKRAPFAVKYLLALLSDEVSEKDTREYYELKYDRPAKTVKLDLSKAPRIGAEDAPIRIVEFFDYQCPHCQAFAPVLQKVAEQQKGKVVEYFLMFPILEGKHTGSRSAAQASLAANLQGKFKEMHHKLFEAPAGLTKEAILGYAGELGLDIAKFTADYDAAEAQVAKDEAQADGLDVHSTPTVYFNERKYEGPSDADYIGMWIEEELAVNR